MLIGGTGFGSPFPHGVDDRPMTPDAPPPPGTSGGSPETYAALRRLLTSHQGDDAPPLVTPPLIEALRTHATRSAQTPAAPAPSAKAAPVEAAPPAPATRYSNPTLRADAPDPTVVRGDDGWFYAHTTQVGPYNLPTLKSKDLTKWEFAGDAMPEKPAWVAKDTWAPKTLKTGDHYTMLYSARGHDGNMRVGYGTAATPAGPFRDRGVLVETANPGYTIDPELVQDGDRYYLYWGSADGSPGFEGIRGQEVRIEPDGAITRLGDPTVTKAKAPDDRLLVEAPTVVKRGEHYFMFYSDGHYMGEGGNSYALNVARSTSPLGPFTDHRRVIGSAGEAFGPGHNSIVTDDAGQDWTVYHARIGSETGPRQLMMDKVDWVDGWPVVNGGAGPTTGSQVGPVVDD